MDDPLPRLGLRFAGLAPRSEASAGQVYEGQDFAGAAVTVVVVAGPAAADPATRRAFAELVARYRGGERPGEPSVHSAEVDAARPWAAVRSLPDRPGAEYLLEELRHPLPEPVPRAEPDPAPTTAAVAIPARPRAAGHQGVVAMVALSVLVAGGLGAGAVWYAERSAAPADVAATGAPPAGPAGPPAPEPAPALPAAPVLREVTPVQVIGPGWEVGDDTYLMALPGLPFAFRTPADWTCFSGTHPVDPEAVAFQCQPPDPARGQRVTLILWECPTTCTEVEQSAMRERWLDEPELAVAADTALTWYVETGQNARGHYEVDLSHFLGDPADPDGPLRWHLGIYLESPSETSDEVLKTLNDIITQASGA